MKRILIANRGEIAVRIIRACHQLGMEAYLVVSSADRDTLGAQLADRTICVGPPPSAASYLNIDAIVAAAQRTGCDAVHPGYGFLAERSAFSRRVNEAGLIFVGPGPDIIDLMGDKVRARESAEAVGVPVPPGTGRVENLAAVEDFCDRYGLPILIKASAGGGGRGMRLVRDRIKIAESFTSASAEAEAAFGDAGVFVERYIERARHIEVQILGDSHGNVIHLGERECSVQRRYQKLIEEAPSAILAPEVRKRMTEAAVKLAAHVNYLGAGTVEFIYDDDAGDFYFLEMNTRIQVEHPVTEMVTGIDLVAAQLEVAAGKLLPIRQSEVKSVGHAIECRINAEDPLNNFRPSPGVIICWQAPNGEGVRVDSHCYSGYRIPPYYDSMIGKLIVWDEDRIAAIRKMEVALGNLKAEGIETTIPFHRAVLETQDFRSGRVRTRWVEEDFLPSWKA